MDFEAAGAAFREFVAVVKALRTPGSGCPWDLEQTHQTLRPYLIEEAYEALEAIDRGAEHALCEEFGDLLLQIVLHAQIADDRSAFSIVDIVQAITEKMIRRHPHVFGKAEADTPEEVHRNWESIKRAEKQEQGQETHPRALLERIPAALPALHRAQSIAGKAERLGLTPASDDDLFESARRALARLEDHSLEQASRGSNSPEERPQEDLGALLFAACRIARRANVNAEDSLRDWLREFVARQESSEA